jgi:fluoroquinolone transport system permease protein
MLWDIRLQFRNGFYYAVLIVIVFAVIFLRQLPTETLVWALPLFILGNLFMNGFFFMSGLVLLEKGEGTLEAQIVTPLRSQEYLAAKVATLTLLSIVENLTVVALTYGIGPHLLAVVVALTLATPLFALFGFMVVVRYDAINEFLMPAIGYASLLSLPLIDYMGVDLSWLIFLHPVQGGLIWLTAAFEAVPVGQLAFSFGYSVIWIVAAGYLSRRAFYRFVILGEGVR